DIVADLVGRLIASGQAVIVGDQDEALVQTAVLQLQVLLQSADVVAEVELARRAQPGQQPLLARNCAVLGLCLHACSPVSFRRYKKPLARKGRKALLTTQKQAFVVPPSFATSNLATSK